jgi:large subunit ribosomal protein L31
VNSEARYDKNIGLVFRTQKTLDYWFCFTGKASAMKKDVHPKYEAATITCACGNTIQTRSTVKEMSVNTCSACHPYFTGQQTLLDTEGRVDQFMKRYGIRKK